MEFSSIESIIFPVSTHNKHYLFKPWKKASLRHFFFLILSEELPDMKVAWSDIWTDLSGYKHIIHGTYRQKLLG